MTSLSVWSHVLRFGDPAAVVEAAQELEELGYAALWYPAFGDGAFEVADSLLGATRTITVATGIRSVWAAPASETAADHAALTAAHPGRFVLGLGVSHAPVVEMEAPDQRYERPLAAMEAFLDELDMASPPVPVSERVLAALGPKMLALARDRADGAHPYLVTPEHTAGARAVLGEGPLLAPEQAAVVETDPAVARERARAHLATYLTLPNYTNNFRRLGFTEDELADGGSDRLVDALVAWGDADAVLTRIREHQDAGADQVALQVLGADMNALPMTELRTIAKELS